MQVTLMNQNAELITMKGRFEQNIVPTLICESIVEVHDNILLPFFFINQEISPERINYYFAKRSYNSNRPLIKDNAHIKWVGDERMPYPPFLSLSDQYWLRSDKNQNWNDINMFDNGFTTEFGDYIFCKQKEKFKDVTLSFLTPDLTSNGILDKRWKIDQNGDQVLIKSKNKMYAQEPLNEILATKILSQFKNKIDFVPYEYEVEQFELCSKCKNFIQKDEEFVPAYHVYKSLEKKDNTSYYTHLLECIEHYNIPNGQEALRQMFFADELTLNRDRHLGNFGYVRNAKTGKIIRPAPLFDFGNAFMTSDEAKKQQNQIFKKEQKEYLQSIELPTINQKDLYKDIFAYPYINDYKKMELKEHLDYHYKERREKDRSDDISR